jgi:hypothetical protein
LRNLLHAAVEVATSQSKAARRRRCIKVARGALKSQNLV